MDWRECLKQRIAKETKEDKNMIISLLETAEIKFNSTDSLADEFLISKISLLYDSLREILEALPIKKGFKIYNHECYTAFLKEILNLSREADIFDNLRKTRNAVNYYGKKLEKEEAEVVVEQLKNLILKFKKMMK
ncbi:MAG: hypothetical protein QW559_01075 [Candidatus Woesearchaeota archaeon]